MSRPESKTFPELILASSSTYRRALLDRLGLPFEVLAPQIDESPQPGESPAAVARRLSIEKAQVIARQRPSAWVIGSDQTATLDGTTIIGKPMTHERARAQLTAASGKTLHFYTGLALIGIEGGIELFDLSEIKAKFRDLSAEQIQAYLLREQPYDCAGSAKSEGLGIALLESMSGSDPTALIGLPLTRLCDLLARCGYDVLTQSYRSAT
jgi:septum formation protein